MKAMLIGTSGLGLAMAMPAAAQNFPLVGGDFVEVTGVTVDDGHSLDYAQFLAGYWKDQEEFAKSQGWTTGFEILSNVNKRKGEPDYYLVRRFHMLADGAESQKRGEAMRQHMKMSLAQMQAATGDRAKFRHVDSRQLLQVLNFK